MTKVTLASNFLDETISYLDLFPDLPIVAKRSRSLTSCSSLSVSHARRRYRDHVLVPLLAIYGQMNVPRKQIVGSGLEVGLIPQSRSVIVNRARSMAHYRPGRIEREQPGDAGVGLEFVGKSERRVLQELS